jgi:hypothetical protein
MATQLECTFIQVTESKTGMKKDQLGTWNFTNILVEHGKQYPKKLEVQVWGNDGLAVKELKNGAKLFIDLDFESKESNGRWYTQAKAVKVTKKEAY